MKVIAVLLLEVLLERKKGGNGLPASLSAWAGSQAGPFGQLPGLTAGLGRFPGRSSRVGLRLPCRPGSAPRPAHSASTPVLSGGPPASLSAWAGSQAGPPGCAPGLPAGLGRLPGRPDGRFPLFFSTNSSILASYLRGFFPK